ncbi:MAG: DUF6569 family protein [candidate division WOR-3 bacterium]
MIRSTLADFLEGIKLEEPRFLRNLVIYPLSNGGKTNLKIKVLDEALKNNDVLISELDSARIEQVSFQNRSDYQVFVLDGEEITGAWQNRITTTAAYIDAKSEVLLPTSCVEQGRWGGKYQFTLANTCSYPSLRAILCKDVTNSLIKTRTFQANQERIWQSVSHKLNSLKVQSKTSSMHDIFSRLEEELSRFSENASALNQFTGVVAVCGERILCLDLFGYQNIFTHLLPKLLTSYGLDALEKMLTLSPLPTKRVREFLNQLKEVPTQRFPSVGLGEEVRFQTDKLLGRALIFGENLLHLAAFPKQN